MFFGGFNGSKEIFFGEDTVFEHPDKLTGTKCGLSWDFPNLGSGSFFEDFSTQVHELDCLIMRYTQRRLTYGEDALLVIEGALAKFYTYA